MEDYYYYEHYHLCKDDVVAAAFQNLDCLINELDDDGDDDDKNQIPLPSSYSLNHYYEMTLEGYKKGFSVEEISNSIDIPLGKTSGFGEPSIVKANFVRSILLENNIIL